MWLAFYPSGMKRNMTTHMAKTLQIGVEFVRKRREVQVREAEELQTKDFLDVLLEYKRDGKEGDHDLNISHQNINIVVMVLHISLTPLSFSLNFLPYVTCSIAISLV